MKQFEYETITRDSISPEGLVGLLNKRSKAGWNPIYVKNERLSMLKHGDFYIILQREIEPEVKKVTSIIEDNSVADNGHSTEKWVVEMKIKSYKKAIENLGGDNMQRIYIAANKMGMGEAMNSGEYVDLSEIPAVYGGIKNVLEKMLEVQMNILENL